MHPRAFALLLPVLILLPGLALAQGLGLPGLGLGMRQVTPVLWIDRAAGPKQVAAIRDRIAAADAKVAKTFGGRLAAPIWQVCVTRACDQRNAMTSRAMTLGGLVITVSSRAVGDPVTFVHERVHAELHRAEGFAGRKKGLLPTWFDEGLATVVSRSVGFPEKRADCRSVAGRPLPVTRADFVALSRSNGRGAGPVYLASACAVLDWLDRGRGPADAVRRLRRGQALP